MKVDLAKRRLVMERSRALGHCICDVRRACPCDVFTDRGICPCAGERPDPVDLAEVKLTRLVRNAGCASKIAPADLEAVLSRLPPVNDPAVISGLAAADDAGIYRLTDNLCLVQTVDVFTPCVDDAHLFGRICAANCLSDIYAMGGEPRTALSIVAFPSDQLPGEVMFQMLAGAMTTLAEAGVALLGGHSIRDDEVKLGFAITGVIEPAVAAALDQPRPGDALVLTKPLGTGVLTFAAQIGRGHAAGLAAAEAAMATLNRAAAEAMREAGASACTDVTGFGLFGHLARLLRPAGLAAEVFAEALPAFPGAREALAQGIVPGAIERNREYVGADLRVAPGVDEASVCLGCDAQTSGGLLIAMPVPRLQGLLEALARRGVPGVVVGRVTNAPAGTITLRPGQGGAPSQQRGTRGVCPSEQGFRKDEFHESQTPCLALPGQAEGAVASPEPQTEILPMNAETPSTGAGHEGCCAEVFKPSSTPAPAAESPRAFGALMRSVQAAGALDERTKELVLFALVVASRCGPCFEAHYQKARALGITQAELDEAAWCAVAMGGAPVRMFYEESLARLTEGKAGSR